MKPTCAYCSDDAKGIDWTGEYTCGDGVTCESVVVPIEIYEISDEDEESENEQPPNRRR